MLRGLYLSATNMLVQRKKVDVTANNIANMDTVGFKADSLVSRSFGDMYLERVNDPGNTESGVGPLNTGVHIDELITSFDEGSLKTTDRALDFAITGDGFFAVSTTAGERYTRDGSFAIDPDGYLVTSDGNRVLGTNGFLRLDTVNVAVDSEGNITNAEGDTLGTLRVVSFADKTGLKKMGNNLYINQNNQPARNAQGVVVRQGALETSNTDITNETLNMMAASRSFETSQRIVKMLDETLGRAVNDIGKV
ncbi:MAG TPA: flagellar basal-body rod protein FlgF [Feifaniaceae bacterium]|nr:flagellar basal-body rod protein FlgF [Feifaniaceae bacterium]